MAAAEFVGALVSVDPDDVMRLIVEKISSKKMRAVDLFKKIDADGGGSLDADELREGFAEICELQFTDAEFAVVMARVDIAGAGEISLREFDRAIKAAEKLPKKKKTAEEAPVVQKKKQGITAEDHEEFRQIFCLFKQLTRKQVSEDGVERLVPMDSSGGISVDELEQLLEAVGMKLRPDDIHNMINDLDKDMNGNIDFEEFCGAMAQEIQVEHEPDELAKCFKSFAHHSPEGYIRVEDLKNALTTYMHKELSAHDVDQLLEHYQDCFVKVPGYDCEFFHYQDYVDLMAPLEDAKQDEKKQDEEKHDENKQDGKKQEHNKQDEKEGTKEGT